MKSNLIFDFTVDKENNSLYIHREFNASQTLVWDTFTLPELLDQWWAPHPYKSRTKHMNFEEGGRRFYAMVGPEGDEHWCIQDFTSITKMDNFQFADAFADAEEKINTEMPSTQWNLDFKETDSITSVHITLTHSNRENFEMHLKMGFKEGFTAGLNQLAELLTRLTN